MDTYIALFRGINVGGHNKLRMKELRALLEDLGCQNVRTYIQSGNVVMQCEEDDPQALAARIGAEVQARHGFKPDVLLLELETLKEAIADNPFPEAESEPRSLHLNFLASVPQDPDMEALESARKESERFELKGDVFYLHAPDGIGRSKLARNAERWLGVPMTGRNWRTVSKIMALAQE